MFHLKNESASHVCIFMYIYSVPIEFMTNFLSYGFIFSSLTTKHKIQRFSFQFNAHLNITKYLKGEDKVLM